MLRTLFLAFGFLFASAPAVADTTHPWVTSNPRLDKFAWFSNLESGAEVESPFVVRFGLTGIGIAAVKHPVEGTGHHHLLVDRDLPLDFTEPLPFNDQYVHFGKGQMEAVLDLPPGPHTLRLVFADQKHIPNFVYSKVLHVTVTGKRAGGAEGLVTPGISLLSPAADSQVLAPFAIVAHASGLNVSHTDITEADTGHFRIRVTPAQGEPVVIDLTQGATEVWLQPPPGRYSVVAELVSNQDASSVLAASPARSFSVVGR